MPDPLAAFQSAVADRYAIEGRLGEGGMAIVFLANDLRHHRAVAVKVLRPEFAAVLGTDRFLREINFAAELNHPHIVPLFDSGVAAVEGHPPLPFYVMPRLQGESLRERIAREGALPIDEARTIARQVAQALAYAHAHGIVHRDIKPANILLSDGEAVVADFGIARAVDRAGDGDRITDSGLTLGTPAYMAPEQTTGDTLLDGRADVYALGCVLYEMLGGSPPFSGATAAAILARHRTDTPPPLRTLRSTVPPQLEAIVMRALAKSPADRFPTAAAMAQALGPASGSMEAIPLAASQRTRRIRPGMLAIAGALLVLAVAWFVPGGRRPAAAGIDVASAFADSALDTTRYAVLPFEYEPGIESRFNEDQMLLDAMARWDGITVIDAFQLRGALGRTATDSLGRDAVAARTAAARLDAGRVIRGEVTRSPDGYRINALLVETASGAVLERASTRLPHSLAGADSSFRMLAERLLLREAGTPLPEEAGTATRSVPARQAFAAGWNALQAWNLDRADSQFAAASRLDPAYSQALLWTALTRSWSGEPPATWRSAAERAVAGRSSLNQRDQRVADAILQVGRGDLVTACATWSELVARFPNDFVPWYGLGDCQSRDSIVVPDRTSRTGWRFRTSHHAALGAYQRALQLLPSIHEGLSANAYEPIRRLFNLTTTTLRMGVTEGDPARSFYALPAFENDSLAYAPVPVTPGVSIPHSPTAPDAVRHYRRQFFDIATAWTTSLPESPTAREALAFAMELLGQPGALNVLADARRLATTPQDRFRLAAQEVWLRIRLGVPADTAGVRVARALADSLLGDSAAARQQPAVAASLAALTGRAGLAAKLMSGPATQREWEVPPVIAPAAQQLLVHAALGAGPAVLQALERDVATGIARDLPVAQREPARLAWLARAATLAYPTYRFVTARELVGSGDYLLDAMEALSSGDSSVARRALYDGLLVPPLSTQEERPADALFPEAWLFVRLQESRTAMHWLDILLDRLYGKALNAPTNPVEAGPLVRAMALRAELAATAGQSDTARLWARSVSTLWSDADRPQQPVVARMHGLLR